MITFSKLFKQVTHTMHMMSGVVLISMMFITLTDVFTRTMFKLTDGTFDFTFIGGIELTKYGLLFVVLFSLPYSVGRSQVIVDLFTDNLSGRIKVILEGIFMLGFVALGGGMCSRFYHAAVQSQMTGETTQDLLIPLYYLYGLSAFATGMLAVAAMLISLRCFFYWKGDKVS